MKKTSFVAALLALVVACGAFAFGKTAVVGRIKIYGSAPMTFVGFVAETGEQYSLDIAPNAKFSLQELCEHQGEPLRLTGVVNKKELFGFQTLADGRFVVSKYKVLKK